jgi:cation:H+ antiporter
VEGNSMLLWLAFIICTATIICSGSRLSKYGDIIAEKTGLGRTWVGFIMLASITSLPELITGISAVTISNVPDIAVGAVLGSCVFNILIYAALDITYRREPLSTRAHQGNTLSAGLGILLLSFVAFSLVLEKQIGSWGWIGLYSLIIVVMYFTAIRMVFFYEKRHLSLYVKYRAVELRYKYVPMKTAVIHYSINGFIIIIAAIFLPIIGEGLALSTGLGNTFVGNIFIALSTSLPEIVVSISAIKMDALDLAIGNLFGSNIFNLLILAIDDVFFIQGPILSFVNANHIISALSAITMTVIAIIGLTYRASKKPLFLAWDSIGIILIYLINLMSLYLLK